MGLPDFVTVILLVIISFFAFNFAVLTFYLWWKLRKARKKRQIHILNEREQQLPGFSQHNSTNTHNYLTPNSSANSGSDGLGRTVSTNNHSNFHSSHPMNNFSYNCNFSYNPNRELSDSANILPRNLIANLETAMHVGNQSQLEKSIIELKSYVNKDTPLNSAINMLSDAETVLETIQLKRNIDTALEIKDIWSVERAVRSIRTSKNASKNKDLIELADKGADFLKINASPQQAMYNLIQSERLEASISMAEIIGLEKREGYKDVGKLIKDRKMKLEIRACKDELLKAIQERQISGLEAALSSCNLLPVKDAELVKEYSRAKMLLDWLSETKQARLRLKTAIIGRDPVILERAISKFKEYNLSDDEGDLRQAQRLSNIFDARIRLVFGIESRDLQVITQAIEYADSVNAHHAPELRPILARSLLLQKQLILTEEILMSVDNNWSSLIGYQNWRSHEIQVMKIFGILLGFTNPESRISTNATYNGNGYNTGLDLEKKGFNSFGAKFKQKPQNYSQKNNSFTDSNNAQNPSNSNMLSKNSSSVQNSDYSPGQTFKTQNYKPLVSLENDAQNCNLHLMLSELGKERLKRRLQSLDVQVLEWHICEQVAPLIEKCKKSFSAKNNAKKREKQRKFGKFVPTLMPSASQENIENLFSTVFEWSQNIVKCVEDRLKARQINMSSNS